MGCHHEWKEPSNEPCHAGDCPIGHCWPQQSEDCERSTSSAYINDWQEVGEIQSAIRQPEISDGLRHFFVISVTQNFSSLYATTRYEQTLRHVAALNSVGQRPQVAAKP